MFRFGYAGTYTFAEYYIIDQLVTEDGASRLGRFRETEPDNVQGLGFTHFIVASLAAKP